MNEKLSWGAGEIVEEVEKRGPLHGCL
jgi:hypothetical protein